MTRLVWFLGAWLVAAAAWAGETEAPPSVTAGLAQHDGAPDVGPSAKSTPAEMLAPTSAGAPAAPVEVSAAGPPASNATSLEALRTRTVQQGLGGRMMGLVGCLVMLGLAWAMSSERRRIDWRLVWMGTALQFLFAFLVLKTPLGSAVFGVANDAVKKLLSFSTQGARFVFGNLVDSRVPVVRADGSATEFAADAGAFIAFNLMPTILFFSALSALLYHLGILQQIVRGLSWAMRRTMGTSGAESLAAAGNIFLGQTEAPLLIRPFLERMTRSELMAVMTGGFATVAGGVLAVYVGFLDEKFPDIAGHLVAASVMSAPASLVMAKIMVPETAQPQTADGAQIHVDSEHANALDATAHGISEGLKLALNVAAMLIGFMALLPLLDWILTWPSTPLAWLGLDGAAAFFAELSLEKIMGVLLAPLAFVLGVPWIDAVSVGAMLGAKTVVNEFVAYLQLTNALETNGLAHGKSVVIATYALCGFSNLGSIGIQIGGLSVIAPSRRKELATLGPRAMVAASLACFQTAALAGMLL